MFKPEMVIKHSLVSCSLLRKVNWSSIFLFKKIGSGLTGSPMTVECVKENSHMG